MHIDIILYTQVLLHNYNNISSNNNIDDNDDENERHENKIKNKMALEINYSEFILSGKILLIEKKDVNKPKLSLNGWLERLKNGESDGGEFLFMFFYVFII